MDAALVIGYGSAGKRHANLLRERYGIDVTSYDPRRDTGATYSDSYEDLINGSFDLAVIATPPDLHLGQIMDCLNSGICFVVCEKPLMTEATNISTMTREYLSNVAVTYNYRYHPGLLDAQRHFSGSGIRERWYMKCVQYRETIPAWGLILDHLSHDVDIMRFMSGSELRISKADYVEDRNRYLITVDGEIEDTRAPFTIHEEVTKNRTIRSADLNTPWGWVSIDASSQMFEDMWDAFLTSFERGERPYPNFWNAYYTTKTLDDIISKMSYWRAP